MPGVQETQNSQVSFQAAGWGFTTVVNGTEDEKIGRSERGAPWDPEAPVSITQQQSKAERYR